MPRKIQPCPLRVAAQFFLVVDMGITEHVFDAQFLGLCDDDIEQNRKLLFNEDGSPTARTKAIWGHTPMNRFGESKELVGAAVFLASHSASSFVTGTDIRVDGGYLSQTI